MRHNTNRTVIAAGPLVDLRPLGPCVRVGDLSSVSGQPGHEDHVRVRVAVHLCHRLCQWWRHGVLSALHLVQHVCGQVQVPGRRYRGQIRPFRASPSVAVPRVAVRAGRRWKWRPPCPFFVAALSALSDVYGCRARRRRTGIVAGQLTTRRVGRVGQRGTERIPTRPDVPTIDRGIVGEFRLSGQGVQVDDPDVDQDTGQLVCLGPGDGRVVEHHHVPGFVGVYFHPRVMIHRPINRTDHAAHR